jgi:hypothetical protein
MKVLHLIILAFIFSVELFAYSPIDTCLKIYDIPEDETLENPYNLRIDSCTRSGSYGEFFAKGYFSVKFNYNIIPRAGIFTEDTLIEYSISDINTKYFDAINEFQKLESRFGTFKFIEERPHRPDTTTLNSRKLSINFDDFVNIRSAKDSIGNINIVTSVGFAHWFRILSSVNEISENGNINYNSQTGTLNINSSSIGGDLIIYDINCVEVYRKKINSTNEIVNINDLSHGLYIVKFKDVVLKIIR